MIEGLVRSYGAELLRVYDRLPVRARHLVTSARGWLLTRNRYSPEARQALEQYRTHESWSTAELHNFQLSELKRIVEHARRTTPFYRGYPRLDWASASDLQQLPVLQREAVRAGADRMLSSAVSPSDRIRVGTTGTTGASLHIVYSNEVARRIWALNLRQWEWAGVAPREQRLTLFGSRVVPPSRTSPPFWAYNLPEKQILLSIFHLSEKTAPVYRAFVETQKGTVLEGFPSTLGILADLVLQEGGPIPMKVVFTTGEPLYPHLRSRIEEAFETRILDSYGMTELVGQIHECEFGRMHIAPECGYLEVLDENDQPVPNGTEGYLVWTGFLNNAMPFIRYRVGDRGYFETDQRCDCGRVFPVVVPGITRQSDFLRTPDGRVFSARALNQSLKFAKSLRFCQLVQEAPDQVLVRAVRGMESAPEDLSRICSELASVLGAGVSVHGRFETEPIIRSGGKIPLIVHQVKN